MEESTDTEDKTQKESKRTESEENYETGWDEEFEWKSTTQHIYFFLLYLTDWNVYITLIYENSKENPEEEVTILHYLVLTILIGCPLLFLQTFIGQYTRRGPFVFGEMMPFANGFGFTILSISFTDFVIQYFYGVYFLFYFFVAINNRHAPWVFCNDEFYAAFPHCFSYEDIDWCPTLEESEEPCFSAEDKILPGTIYMHYVGLNKLEGSKEIDDMYPEAKKKIFYLELHALILFILLVIVSGRSLKNFEVLLKFVLATIIACVLSMLVIVFTQSGGLLGLTHMFKKITFASLFSFHTWVAAFRRIIDILKLAEAGHILFGSFIPINNLSPYRAVYLSLSFFVTAFLFFVYFFLFQGLFFYKLGLSMKDLNLDNEQRIIFVFFPYLLGVQAVGRFFCIIYFAILLLITFCSLNIKLFMLEKTISSHFKITSHFIYIKYGIVILANVGSVLLTLPDRSNGHANVDLSLLSWDFINNRITYGRKGVFWVSEELLDFCCGKKDCRNILRDRLLEILSFIPILSENMTLILHEYYVFLIATLLLQLLVILLYGIQRFSDDVHFYLHIKVALFLKICWILSPFLCLTILLVDLYSHPIEDFTSQVIRIIIFSVSYVPILIFFCKIIFIYAKNKNLIGLLKPMDSYGPPDIIQRIYRILYNPRLTVKYKRQIELCNHECLIKSFALERAIEQEIMLIEKLAKAVEINMSSIIYLKVSERLKEHCELLVDPQNIEKLEKIYSKLKTPILKHYESSTFH